MNTAQDNQLVEIVSLLKNLGYDLSKDESKVFVDLVVESLEQINNGKSIDEVYELIADKKKSPIYVELAYFIYEKGMPYIHDSLENFQSTFSEYKSNKELYSEVFQNKNCLNAYDAAFCIVKYLDEIHAPKQVFQKCKYNN